MEKILKTDLDALAKRVLSKLTPYEDRATLLTLSGNLGAGKTTFVQALARELGLREAIQSPTYVLMKKYELSGQPFKALIHIDVYRLDAPEQLEALDPQTFLATPNTLVIIEWPERVEGALPTADLTLRFSAEAANEEERYIDGI